MKIVLKSAILKPRIPEKPAETEDTSSLETLNIIAEVEQMIEEFTPSG